MIHLAAGQSLLRQLASPEGQAELADAADALEERPRLLARIAELEDPDRHLVRGGDTLWSLARAYGTTVTQLREWNGLTGEVIVVGTTLRVR